MHAHRHPARPVAAARAQRGLASRWIFAGFLAVAGFFFFTEHRAHVMGALPYVLLALCPLMHLLHGRHHHGRGAAAERDSGAPADDDVGRPLPPPGPRPPPSH